MSNLSNDWRLTNQMKYLKGLTLYYKAYTKYRDDWDHDHCEFCGIKFMEPPHDALHEGYATQNNYRWICKECFEDFKEMFEWELDKS